MGEENRCFVGGLSWNTDDRLLSEAFAQYGVTDAKVRGGPFCCCSASAPAPFSLLFAGQDTLLPRFLPWFLKELRFFVMGYNLPQGFSPTVVAGRFLCRLIF